VNLPAKDKLAAPGYQTLLDAEIPSVALPDGAGSVRVIAGRYGGGRGPARTFTPMDVWDMRLSQGGISQFEVEAGRTLALIVLDGAINVNGQDVREAQMVMLDPDGQGLEVRADTDAVVLLLSGEPIDEPIVGYGPFVMNSEDEIAQAVSDFNRGQFGQIAH